MKVLTLNWVDNGYGVPRMVHVIYIVKLVLFYALGGIVVATLTSELPASGMFRIGGTTDRLPESHPVDGAARNHRRRGIMGPAGRQDQADDRRHPVLGPARHDQVAALAAVPFTAGNRRTWFDVVLYLA